MPNDPSLIYVNRRQFIGFLGVPANYASAMRRAVEPSLPWPVVRATAMFLFFESDSRIMTSNRDRLGAIGGALRKGFTIPDRSSDRQFQDLLHRLAKVSAAKPPPND